MYKHGCIGAWGVGNPCRGSQTPQPPSPLIAPVRANNRTISTARTDKPQIAAHGIASRAPRHGNTSCSAADASPGAPASHGSLNAILDPPIATLDHESGTDVGGAASSGPHDRLRQRPRGASPQLTTRLVLLAAENAACLSSQQVRGLVQAIRHAAEDPDRRLQLPPAAVNRLVRELRSRRQLAIMLDLPEALWGRRAVPQPGPQAGMEPQAGPDPHERDAVEEEQQQRRAHEAVGEHVAEADARHVGLQVVATGSAAAAVTAAAAAMGTCRAVAATLTAGAQDVACGRADTPPANGNQGAVQPQATQGPPDPPDVLSGGLQVAAGSPHAGQPRRPPGQQLPMGASDQAAAAQSQPTPSAATDPTPVRKAARACAAGPVPSPATAGGSAVSGIAQLPPPGPGPGSGLAEPAAQPHPTEQQPLSAQDGNGAAGTGAGDGEDQGDGHAAELCRFFRELQAAGPRLAADEALAALETCAVVRALPPRYTYEALLRTVRRGAAAAMAAATTAATAAAAAAAARAAVVAGAKTWRRRALEGVAEPEAHVSSSPPQLLPPQAQQPVPAKQQHSEGPASAQPPILPTTPYLRASEPSLLGPPQRPPAAGRTSATAPADAPHTGNGYAARGGEAAHSGPHAAAAAPQPSRSRTQSHVGGAVPPSLPAAAVAAAQAASAAAAEAAAATSSAAALAAALPPTRLVTVLYGLTRLGQRLSQPLWRELLAYLEPSLAFQPAAPPPGRHHTPPLLGGRRRAAAQSAAPPAGRPTAHLPLSLYDLVDLATAMATAGCNPSTPFLVSHAAAVMGWARHLTGRQAARLLWAYASLDFRPPAAVQGALAATLAAQAAEVQADELARAAQALVLMAAVQAAELGFGAGRGAAAVVIGGGGSGGVGVYDWVEEEAGAQRPAVGAGRLAGRSSGGGDGGAGGKERRGGALRDVSYGPVPYLLEAATACIQQHQRACQVERARLQQLPPEQASPRKRKRKRKSGLEAGMENEEEEQEEPGAQAMPTVNTRPVGELLPLDDPWAWMPSAPPLLGGAGVGRSASTRAAADDGGASQRVADSAAAAVTATVAAGQPQLSNADLTSRLQALQEQEQLLAWLAAATASDGARLPPLPPRLSAEGLATVSRLVAALGLMPDAHWSRRLLALAAPLTEALRPADLVSAVRLACRLYSTHPELLAAGPGPASADARGRAARGSSARPPTVAQANEVSGRDQRRRSEEPRPHSAAGGPAALRGLVAAACSSLDGLSYGQVFSMYGSVSLLCDQPRVRAWLGANGWLAAAATLQDADVGAPASGSVTATVVSSDAMLLALGAHSRPQRQMDGRASGAADAVPRPGTADGAADPACWLMSLLNPRPTPIPAPAPLLRSRPPASPPPAPPAPLQAPTQPPGGAASSSGSPAAVGARPRYSKDKLYVTIKAPAAAVDSGTASTLAPAAAAATSALAVLVHVLRSCADARVPLPPPQLEAMRQTWRRHLGLGASPQLSTSGPPRHCSGAELQYTPKQQSPADPRVVAELLLAVTIVVPRAGPARRELVLELAEALTAGGAAALAAVPSPRLAACFNVVAGALSGGLQADYGHPGCRSTAATVRRMRATAAVVGPLLVELQRRLSPPSAAGDAAPPQAAHPAGLSPQSWLHVFKALSLLSYSTRWPPRLRMREAKLLRIARAALASPSARPLRALLLASLPRLSGEPSAGAVRYSLWVLRLVPPRRVGRAWLSALLSAAPRHLRFMHPVATVEWLAACAAVRQVPPPAACRSAWLHLRRTWPILAPHRQCHAVFAAVRLGLRPPRDLLAAAVRDVAAAAVERMAAVQAAKGEQAGGAAGAAAKGERAGAAAAAAAASLRHVVPSDVIRLIWAVQCDGRFAPPTEQVTDMCRLVAWAWPALRSSMRVAALSALARMAAPGAGTEAQRVLHESGLGAAVVKNLAANMPDRRSREARAVASSPASTSADRSGLVCGGNAAGEGEAAGDAPQTTKQGFLDVVSPNSLARLCWALSRLRLPLPSGLAAQLGERLGAVAGAAADAAAQAGTGATLATPTSAPTPGAGPAADATARAPARSNARSPLGPKEAAQALYAVTQLTLRTPHGIAKPTASSASPSGSSPPLVPLLRLLLATPPARLDAPCVAECLGTLSRFRVPLARHRTQLRQEQQSHQRLQRQRQLQSQLQQTHEQYPEAESGAGAGPSHAPPAVGAGAAAAAGVRASSGGAGWGDDPWVRAALDHAGELFERSVLRGLGDRPAPAWCVLEALQAAAFLGAPLGPRLAAAAPALLAMHLPAMPPCQLADVVGCCAAAAPQGNMPAELAWEALQRLVALEARTGEEAGEAQEQKEERGEARGHAHWRGSLEPDELARVVMAAPQALPAAPAQGASPDAAPTVDPGDRFVLPRLRSQQQQRLAEAVVALACRPDDPRVSAMTPDQLSMLLHGVAAAGAAPGAVWLRCVSGLLLRRAAESSSFGLVRTAEALAALEFWPGQEWERRWLQQASTLAKAHRMPRGTMQQLQGTLLRLRATGAAADAKTFGVPSRAIGVTATATATSTSAANDAAVSDPVAVPAEASPTAEPSPSAEEPCPSYMDAARSFDGSGTFDSTGNSEGHALGSLVSSATHREADLGLPQFASAPEPERVARRQGQQGPTDTLSAEASINSAASAVQPPPFHASTTLRSTADNDSPDARAWSLGAGDDVMAHNSNDGSGCGDAPEAEHPRSPPALLSLPAILAAEAQRVLHGVHHLRRVFAAASYAVLHTVSPAAIAAVAAASPGGGAAAADTASTPDTGLPHHKPQGAGQENAAAAPCAALAPSYTPSREGHADIPPCAETKAADLQRTAAPQAAVSTRRGPDALWRLLLVTRLAEARVDTLMALALKLAALQSAYALHVLRGRGGHRRAADRVPAALAPGGARKKGQRLRVRVEPDRERVRVQSWGGEEAERARRGQEDRAGREVAVASYAGIGAQGASVRVTPESLRPLADYLMQQEIRVPHAIAAAAPQQQQQRLRLQLRMAGGAERSWSRPRWGGRGSVEGPNELAQWASIGARQGGLAAAPRAGDPGLAEEGLLACLVHVKYCGLSSLLS